MKKIVILVLLILSVIILGGCVAPPHINGGYGYGVHGSGYYQPYYGGYGYGGYGGYGGNFSTLPCGGYTRCW